MKISTTTRRAVAVSVLALPLAIAVPGLAFAGDSGHDGGHDGGHNGGHNNNHGQCSGDDQDAFQGGSLIGVLGQVNPATNIGGILNLAPNDQVAETAGNANSGIQQSAGGCGVDQDAFQVSDLVSGLLQVNPATNVGGVGSLAPNDQVAETAGNANSGIQQAAAGGGHHNRGGHGADQTAVQGGSLIGVVGQINPATNVGGIANLAPNEQNAETAGNANSGVQQAGARHGGDQTAVQGGGLLNLNLQVSPATNIGGILNLAPNTQNAGTAGNSNSGIQQHG